MNPIACFRAIFFLVIATLCPISIAGVGPVFAQTAGISSGLPVPRFVSVRNAPSNVRVGPGTNYDIAWTYVRSGIPVEIIQEFDTWRKIRDVDGEEGWLHQNLLVGTRTALVSPWTQEGQTPLRTQPNGASAVRAWLGSNLLVQVRVCDGSFCEVRLDHTNANGSSARYNGFVPQESLWGVYSDEEID